MRYPIVATVAVAATLGMSVMAFAQTYPPPAYAPPPVTYAPYWDGSHSNGGAARAYSYWGGQKTN